jgi:hypothetical protein
VSAVRGSSPRRRTTARGRAAPGLLPLGDAVSASSAAGAALGASARFQVPDDHGVLHSSTTAHAVFTLPPTFGLAHSVLANTPEIGT